MITTTSEGASTSKSRNGRARRQCSFNSLCSPNRVRQVEYVSTSEVTLTNQGTEPSDSERNATSQPEVVPSEFAMLKQTDPESISEERGTIRNLINFGKDKSQYKDLYFVGKLKKERERWSRADSRSNMNNQDEE